VGNLTWPVIVSLIGLLLPVGSALVKDLGERSSLRQLERLAPIVAAAKADSDTSTVVAALRALQNEHIAELSRQLGFREKRRGVTVAVVYLALAFAGVVASGIAVNEVIANADLVGGFWQYFCWGLVGFNALGVAIAVRAVILALRVDASSTTA
jgi:hypothetical protein